MDKITGIVNNNLRSVIDGIREHLSESESLLEKINKDMDKKVNQAQEYKEEVSKSKDTINSIEDEIAGLEKDLNDLNEKFGDTDFKAILSAGNKEINTKIIEKRGSIQRESQKILNLTEKARQLREDLLDLREKKTTLEYDIKETEVVEKFYSKKVNEIIDFVEAGNDLESFIGNTPQTELMTNTNHEEELIEVSQVLNDHVFEEIDAITSSEPDASLVEEALRNAVKVTYVMDTPKVEETKTEPVVTTTVVPATPVETKTEEPEVKITQIEVEPAQEVKVEEAKTEEPKDGIENKTFKAVVTEDLTKKPLVETVLVDKVEAQPPIEEEKIEEEKPTETVLVDKIEPTVEPKKENPPMNLNDLIDKTIANMSYPSFDDSSIDLNMLDDDVEDEEEKEELLPGEEPEIDFDDSVVEINIEDDEEEEEKKETASPKVDGEYLSSIGFDSSKVKAENIKDLMNMDKTELDKKIDVLKKHNLTLSSIYSNADVLTKMKAEDIDAILTVLANASKEDLSSIVPTIDKVDVEKLKESVEVNKDKSLIDMIIPAINSVDDNLKDLLSMTDEEYETLKSSVSEEIYKKLNIMSNIVVENYNVLNSLGVSNIRECLTKYPTKLLTDPKEFKAILDKYDQDDLVRCINKNAKVFDKI